MVGVVRAEKRNRNEAVAGAAAVVDGGIHVEGHGHAGPRGFAGVPLLEKIRDALPSRRSARKATAA